MIGFRHFREKYFQEHGESKTSVYQRLASSGQTPKTLLIGCSDSRVDPAILTGAEPGDLFVIRNVANLVPPCETSSTGFHGTSAALEFAIVNLKVENVIILGHRQCGGILAMVRGAADNKESFIGHWMSIAQPANHKVLHDHPKESEDTRWRLTEMESLKHSLANLQSFPFVKQAIAERQLNVMALYFDLERGELWEYDEPSHQFRQMEI